MRCEGNKVKILELNFQSKKTIKYWVKYRYFQIDIGVLGMLVVRRRYRVRFNRLIGIQVSKKSADRTGRSNAPTSSKLLGVLRILGRGICYDGIKELTLMSETSRWKNFHEFCE